MPSAGRKGKSYPNCFSCDVALRLLTQYEEGRRARRRLPGWEGLDDVRISLPQKVGSPGVSFHKTKGCCEDW